MFPSDHNAGLHFLSFNSNRRVPQPTVWPSAQFCGCFVPNGRSAQLPRQWDGYDRGHDHRDGRPAARITADCVNRRRRLHTQGTSRQVCSFHNFSCIYRTEKCTSVLIQHCKVYSLYTVWSKCTVVLIQHWQVHSLHNLCCIESTLQNVVVGTCLSRETMVKHPC